MSTSSFNKEDNIILKHGCLESTLGCLPNEIIIRICEYLSGKDLLNFIVTNKRFNILDDKTINDAKVIAKIGGDIEGASYKFYKMSCNCIFLSVPKNISLLSRNIQKILYDKAIKLSIKNCTYYSINNITSIKNPLDDDDIVYYIISMTKASGYQKELIGSIDYSRYNVGNILLKLAQKGYNVDNIIDVVYNNFIDNACVGESNILNGSYLMKFIKKNPEFWVIIIDYIINKNPQSFGSIYMSKEEYQYIIDNLEKQLLKTRNNQILHKVNDIFYEALSVGNHYVAYLNGTV